MQRIDSNADAPAEPAADTEQRREDLQPRRTGSAPGKAAVQQHRAPRKGDAPMAKPRRWVGASMDFGVQVYAPERPRAPSSKQVGCFLG